MYTNPATHPIPPPPPPPTTPTPGFLLHHWDGKALDGLRLAFCSEGAEAGGKCAAPVLVPGGPGFQDITVRG